MSKNLFCPHCKKHFKNINSLNGHKNACKQYKKYLVNIVPELIELYVENEYSRRELSTLFDIHIKVVTRILKENNVYIRNKFESHNTTRTKEKIKSTWLQKYGVENVFQAEEIKDQIKKTKLEKYGDEFYNNREKNKETNLDRRGVENVFQAEEIKDQIKKTNLDRIGVEYSMQSKDVMEKSKETKLEKYGDEFYNNIEQIKKTCIEKYGVDNFRKSKEMKEMLWSEEAKQKSLETKIKNGNATDWSKYDASDWDFYCFHVRKLTEINYKNNLEIINPNNVKRGAKDFHLDHIVPIIVGFENNIDIDIVASVYNLQMIPAKNNVSKNRFCSEKDINNLLEMYNENH